VRNIYKIIIFIYLLTTVYAVSRYHIFGPVWWKDIFLFTFNKIIIFSAVIFLFLSVFSKLQTKDRELLTQIIGLSILMHAVFSLLILKPYYLKSFFYPQQGFSLWGNISLVFAGLAFAFYFFRKQFPVKNAQKLIWIFILLHVAAMGWHGWIQPDTWYGYMPPITLLAFVLVGARALRKG